MPESDRSTDQLTPPDQLTRRIHRFEKIQGLEHDGSLGPVVELVNLDSFIRGLGRLLDVHLPVGEIRHREETTLLLHAAHDLLCDVSFIEAIIGRIDRIPARFARRESILLRQGPRVLYGRRHCSGR